MPRKLGPSSTTFRRTDAHRAITSKHHESRSPYAAEAVPVTQRMSFLAGKELPLGRISFASTVPARVPMHFHSFCAWRPSIAETLVSSPGDELPAGVDVLHPHGPLRGCRSTTSGTRPLALAIRAGAHPKAIQERLGHASIPTTLDRPVPRPGRGVRGASGGDGWGVRRGTNAGRRRDGPRDQRCGSLRFRQLTCGFVSSWRWESNPRPPPYHGGALPTELLQRGCLRSADNLHANDRADR